MYKGDKYAKQYLLDNYKKVSNKNLIKHLGCTVEYFYQLLMKYKIDKQRTEGRKGNNTEYKYLADVPTKTRKPRTETLRKKQYIKDNYNKQSSKEIASELGISVRAVNQYAQELCLTDRSIDVDQRDKELEKYVLANYKDKSIPQMEKEMKTSRRKIYQLLEKNEIEYKKLVRKHKSTRTEGELKEIKNYIKENFEDNTLIKIGKDLGITHQEVGRIARDMGLSKDEIKYNKAKKFVLENYETMSKYRLVKDSEFSQKLIDTIFKDLGLKSCSTKTNKPVQYQGTKISNSKRKLAHHSR